MLECENTRATSTLMRNRFCEKCRVTAMCARFARIRPTLALGERGHLDALVRALELVADFGALVSVWRQNHDFLLVNGIFVDERLGKTDLENVETTEPRIIVLENTP